MQQVAFPIYVMKLLGVQDVVITNACGGINREFEPGDLMLIDDFINTTSQNPLQGENDERLGPRFPDMTEPFSLALQTRAMETAQRLGIPYRRGVYALFQGRIMKRAQRFAPSGAWAQTLWACPPCRKQLRQTMQACAFWALPASPTWQLALPQKSIPTPRCCKRPTRRGRTFSAG